MWGAVIGDIVGSVYEFNWIKYKNFDPLFSPISNFTDDTVCTVALADCFMNGGDATEYLRRWCNRYPNMGYGTMFSNWLSNPDMEPYNSYGNGAAMRVSSAAMLTDNLDDALEFADLMTYPTHGHHEGLKGARATTEAIWLAYMGTPAEIIRERIALNYEYDLSRSVDEIRPDYIFNETCQETVPQAIICALEAIDFEDAIRNAVSLGGDSDTLACIAGSIAEARFGCPAELIALAKTKLPDEMIAVLDALYEKRRSVHAIHCKQSKNKLELTIADLETSGLLLKNWATKSIGLLSPERRGSVPPQQDYLQVYFHDCDVPDRANARVTSPTKSDVENILSFSKSFTAKDRVLIHCQEGISRSSAVAIAVLVQHGLSPKEAFEYAERVRPCMYPNKLILRYADELLGQQGQLIIQHDAWLEASQGAISKTAGF